jgi:small subunit ribosomal protein S4
MSRIGPRLKIVRRLGVQLPGLTAKDAERRPYPPGQHGLATGRRRKISLFRKRLEAKQAVRFYYGISEAQLRRTFLAASRLPGRTADALFSLLESRLDNVVFRLGIARTIPAARQLVVHGHIRINGLRVDRPGFRVRLGQTVSLDQRLAENVHIQKQWALGPMVALPEWLAIDPTQSTTGRMLSTPTRASVPFGIDDAAIVEYYAR